MAADDQTPTPDELIGAGIDAIVAVRPSTLRHINLGRGVYANIFAGWRAQAALMCRRAGDFALQGRLRHASGSPLRFLAGSEFSTPATLTGAKAVGQVQIARAPGRVGGTIRKGSRFQRPADESDLRLWTDAQYVAAGDTLVRDGDTEITIPLEASREGIAANRPNTGTLATELTIADDIVDRSAWSVVSYEMAGGADAASDQDLKRYAAAFSTGQYGPNTQAALAGALKAGARHVIAIDDPSVAALVLYVADATWASSERWAKLIRQFLYENRIVGNGCKVLVQSASNLVVGANATCRVRHPSYLTETTTLDSAIQKAVRSYFDDRTDWNRFSLAALRGVAARADKRLLTCTELQVVRFDGTVLSEPGELSTAHYFLADQAVRVTYLPPV